MEKDQNLYFWKDILKSFWNKIESQLLAINTTYNLESLFSMADVAKIAKQLLKHYQFDNEQLSSKNDDSDLGNFSSLNEESSFKDSDLDSSSVSDLSDNNQYKHKY